VTFVHEYILFIAPLVITVVPVTLEMLAFCNNCVSAVVFEMNFFIF